MRQNSFICGLLIRKSSGKIANHYYNANKAWGFGRYLEKLEKIKAEEENREQFLAYMKHFAYS